jgi:hypothetical protein
MLVVILLVGGWFYVPMLFKLATYKGTTGRYVSKEYEVREEHYAGSGRPVKEEMYIAVIRFNYQGKDYFIKAGDYFSEGNEFGAYVPVRFNSSHPEKAFVNSFLGYWAYPLYYAVPIVVLAAGFVLAVEMRLARRKNKMFTDSGITLKLEE